MITLWLTALHVGAAMTWIAGMILLGLTGTVVEMGRDAGLRRIRMWNRRVTTPAMVATWVLGITLATRAGWFASPWLWVKLTIVFALSALHGRLSGRLRRGATSDARRDDDAFPVVPSLVVAATAAIAVLAFVKPF